MGGKFKWRHFAGEVILLCVRWYCRYGISYRELEEMMGWWQLDPGQSATVVWTTNRYAMFFAEDDVGAQWAGDRVTAVPSGAFDWCWNTASTDSEDVGMRVLDSTNAWAPWVSTIKLS